MRWLHYSLSAWLCQLASGYTSLSDASLKAIPQAGRDFDIKTGALLAPILIPRVPGTPGSEKVFNHFVDFFQKSLPKWDISFQNSSSVTPTSNGKEVPFHNIIVTRDPPWAEPGESGRLALVAHYDSKLTPKDFIGATDSAAPCAMIMQAVRSIDGAMTKKWDSLQAEGKVADGMGDTSMNQGIQVILLDGEEAFAEWNDHDSIYGARSLAEEWEQTMNPALATYRSPLESIDLFVLLDLLGSKGPFVPSYFKTTHWAYKKLADVEGRLRKVGMIKSSPNHPAKRQGADSKRADEPMFMHEKDKLETGMWLGGMIGDDHLPFLHRGVEILHLIPHPFPTVWHNKEDDGEHLDTDTTEDWATIMTAFAAEWMDLEGFMTGQGSNTERNRETPHVKDELEAG